MAGLSLPLDVTAVLAVVVGRAWGVGVFVEVTPLDGGCWPLPLTPGPRRPSDVLVVGVENDVTSVVVRSVLGSSVAQCTDPLVLVPTSGPGVVDDSIRWVVVG